MYIEGNSDEEGNMMMCFTLADGANAKFSRNSGGGFNGYGGEAYVSHGCDVVISGDIYFENNSGVRAGAMYMDETRTDITGQATFISNTAEKLGGKMMVIDSDSSLEFSGQVTF